MWTKTCVNDVYQLLFMVAKITNKKRKREGRRKEGREEGNMVSIQQ